MAKSIQAQKANRRAGVRTDQASQRLQAVPVARHRESEGRMGLDLHRPQPHQARKSRLTSLSLRKPNRAKAIWTGSYVRAVSATASPALTVCCHNNAAGS